MQEAGTWQATSAALDSLEAVETALIERSPHAFYSMVFKLVESEMLGSSGGRVTSLHESAGRAATFAERVQPTFAKVTTVRDAMIVKQCLFQRSCGSFQNRNAGVTFMLGM